MTHTMFLKNLR